MADTPLKLFNSLTREIEPFEPVHPGEARVYSCGPTVYNYPHIGNMRAYVFADVLGRTLRWKGYDLKHIINITDVGHLTDDGDAGEDKLEKMAAEKSQSIWDVAEHYTAAFKADIDALNINQPSGWSVATDYVPQMIDFAKRIADKHCYELDSGLYFDISTVNDYGRLARAVTEDDADSPDVRGRIKTVEGKRNAADFAIWRKTPSGETRQMEWNSPWGRGAPGWHLECSVMGEKLLGFPFDIHTGGIDHREIHHPNEIAQNQAFCGCGGLSDAANSGAKIWMHNNFLVERSGKMSKSSGEFLRLKLLVDRGYHPMAYRMMCLQAHYRSELEFSWEGLGAALTRFKRMVMGVQALRGHVSMSNHPVELGPPTEDKIARLFRDFDINISDDLNTSASLALLENVIGWKGADPEKKIFAIIEIDAVLGLNLLDISRTDLRLRPKAAEVTEDEIIAQLRRRKTARKTKDFATSDAIRDDLAAKGVELMDGDPLEWDWKLV